MDQSKRIELHEILCEVLGSNHVYFQPPETIRLVYPCIIYKRENVDTVYADDKLYKHKVSYVVTVIDRNPDSQLIERLLYRLPLIRFNRHFTSENLNHDVFTLFY